MNAKAREKGIDVKPNGDGTQFFIITRGRGSRSTLKLPRKAMRRLARDIDHALRTTKQTPMFESEIEDASIREEDSVCDRNGAGNSELSGVAGSAENGA